MLIYRILGTSCVIIHGHGQGRRAGSMTECYDWSRSHSHDASAARGLGHGVTPCAVTPPAVVPRSSCLGHWPVDRQRPAVSSDVVPSTASPVRGGWLRVLSGSSISFLTPTAAPLPAAAPQPRRGGQEQGEPPRGSPCASRTSRECVGRPPRPPAGGERGCVPRAPGPHGRVGAPP